MNWKDELDKEAEKGDDSGVQRMIADRDAARKAFGDGGYQRGVLDTINAMKQFGGPNKQPWTEVEPSECDGSALGSFATSSQGSKDVRQG